MPAGACGCTTVEQVFNNLIKNAWEAWLHDFLDPKIFVHGRRDDNPNFVLVSVQDNGPGIPEGDSGKDLGFVLYDQRRQAAARVWGFHL
jgi:C4-dicarboxylate-specific signal transduction histidine kinase